MGTTSSPKLPSTLSIITLTLFLCSFDSLMPDTRTVSKGFNTTLFGSLILPSTDSRLKSGSIILSFFRICFGKIALSQESGNFCNFSLFQHTVNIFQCEQYLLISGPSLYSLNLALPKTRNPHPFLIFL